VYRTFAVSVEFLARLMALIGGAVLLALIVMTCLSIIGRTLGSFGLAPVPGDFELVELGVGFAIFAFLPWCHLRQGHAAVDLFRPRFSKNLNLLIDWISDVLMLVVAFLITWRLWIGMLDKKNYTETTFILQFPMWIAYGAGLLGAVAFLIVAVFCVFRSARKLLGTVND